MSLDPLNQYQEERQEAPGEAAYRWATWLFALGRAFGIKWKGKRHEDAAAILFQPVLARFPRLTKWKAPRK